MKYSIVIPTYNHCDDLLKPCVESIFQFSNMADVELIISANGCTDNTKWYLNYLRNQFDSLGLSKHLKVVWSDEPLGYPKAINVGIEASTTNKIILLNNDTILLGQNKSDWLDILDRPFGLDHKIGITCVMKSYSEAADRPFAVFFCVMIHRRVFDTIGLLNEEYGSGGGEDVEFSIEAENAGFIVSEINETKLIGGPYVFGGEFPIWHKGQQTMYDTSLIGDYDHILYLNKLKLAKKYNKAWYYEKMPKSLDDLSWLSEKHAGMYKEVIKDNCYELDETVMKDRNVIDIGANIGAFSILSAFLGAKKVISVEPVGSTYASLIENIEKSELTTIVPLKNIVSQETGNICRISSDELSGGNSMYNVVDGYENVETITLTDILNQMEGDEIFLKLDCEGAEYDILLNVTQDEMNRVNQLVLEIHTDLHPIYKGSEIIENKLLLFGFTQMKSNQIYYWEYDENWLPVNQRELPYKVEFWKRV